MSRNCESCPPVPIGVYCHDEIGGPFLPPISDENKLPARQPDIAPRNIIRSRVKLSTIIGGEVCYDCIESGATQECEDTNPVYLETGLVICEEISGQRTGYSLTELRDVNQCSSTFNQITFRRQSSVFCIPQVTPVLTIFEITC